MLLFISWQVIVEKGRINLEQRYKRQELNIYCLLLQSIDLGNVLSLGFIGGETLEFVPAVPLGATLRIKEAGAISVDIANGSLLVQTVDITHVLCVDTTA
eukprot:TRINITY_DN1571_c0_g2_i1.p1 TRINITY_DN1571_c0_g2~~TRINITY_DN1571_c0_g2_i1.p1  ORF type:complete len:100 (+),score=5.04 TRINITY_DN1571_c0_g2_i1:53-352(+)